MEFFSLFDFCKKKIKKENIFDNQNSQIVVKFGSIWAKMGHFWIFNKKAKSSFFRLQRLGFMQRNRKFQFAVFEKKNANNLCFWAFWVKMDQIGPKRGHFWIFGQKVKTSPSFFFQNKILENTNGRFQRKSGGWRETDRETDWQRRMTIYRS